VTWSVWSPEAFGGAAVPVSLLELVSASSAIVVGVPRRASSAWEGDGDGRRIVTLSRVEVLQAINERAPKDSIVTVQTLGGRVRDVGQIVHGEAALELNRPAVLFLRAARKGQLRVTAMAQGHYPLRDDERGDPRLHQSPRLGDFVVTDPYGAVARLRGKTLGACERLIAEELSHGH
jgi:hypothetical protein